MTTITWLHISDLHFRIPKGHRGDLLPYDANIVLRALLRDVDERIQKDGLRPDFIAVTGDIAFSGKSAEYALARRFFDDLLQTTGLAKDCLFLVPGNHDVDRDRISLPAEATAEKLTDRDSTNEILSEASNRKLMFARFKGYAQFVNDYFEGHLQFDDEHYFYTRTLDLAGRQIALLGLNSAWLCASDKDKANGLLIGERQAWTALDQVAGPALKVVLLHHPFDWLRGFEHDSSVALLTDSCDFILHGHLHHPGVLSLQGPDAEAMIVAAGACYKSHKHPNSYNFMNLDYSTNQGTVILRTWSSHRGGFWTKDTTTYRNVSDGKWTFELPEKLLTSSISLDDQETETEPEFGLVKRDCLEKEVVPHLDGTPSLRLFECRGIPGIGKTKLLEDLWAECKRFPNTICTMIKLAQCSYPDRSWPMEGRYILALNAILQKWHGEEWFPDEFQGMVRSSDAAVSKWKALNPTKDPDGVKQCISSVQERFQHITQNAVPGKRIVLIFDEIDAEEDVYRLVWEPLEGFLTQHVLYENGSVLRRPDLIIVVGRRTFRKSKRESLEIRFGYTSVDIPLFEEEHTHEQIGQYLGHRGIVSAIHALSAGHPRSNRDLALAWRRLCRKLRKTPDFDVQLPELTKVVEDRVISQCLLRFKEERRKWPVIDYLLCLFRFLDGLVVDEFFEQNRISEDIERWHVLEKLEGSYFADCSLKYVRIDTEWRKLSEAFLKHSRSQADLLLGHESARNTFYSLIHVQPRLTGIVPYAVEWLYHLLCRKHMAGEKNSIGEVQANVLQEVKYILSQHHPDERKDIKTEFLNRLQDDEDIESLLGEHYEMIREAIEGLELA